jgi:carbon monoxide dehydrogenase subunit G
MDMKGEQFIPASQEVVWAALNNPDILKKCIPGCQELVKLSDTQMTAAAAVKVGPITAKFQGSVSFSDIDPPNGYKISGEGQGGAAGFAKGGADVRLVAADGGTNLHYEVSAQVGGKLAQLGGRLIDATAKQLSGQFFKRLAAEIAPKPAEAALSDSSQQDIGAGARPAAPRFARQAEAAAAPRIFGAAVAGGGVALAGAALVWLAFGRPEADRLTVAPDFVSTVQLIMAAAIGYLFGARMAAKA